MSSNMGHEGDILKLKELLLKKEISELNELKEKIDKPHNFSKQVAGVLPEAFKRATSQSDDISKNMVPIVEKTILKSVSRNPRPMADALFPIIGPAIRKSIYESLKILIQNINKTIENSLSWQGLKWRMESLLTKRSYAEIVLAKSLIFRVREVFLIHAETGLLLKHVELEGINSHEADMVSSMLKAIQDFVSDSFVRDGEAAIGTVEIGDLQIWIEQGPWAIMAAVIEGHPPGKIRENLIEANEAIHSTFPTELNEFDGDTVVFEPTEEILNTLLVSKFETKKKAKGNFWAWAFLIAALLLIGTLIYNGYKKKERFNQYIEKVKQISGIIITNTGKYKGNYIIEGLKDPDAENPSLLSKEFRIDSTKLRFNFKPYFSIENDLILKRLYNIVNPPPNLKFSMDKGILKITGTSSLAWINENRKALRSMPGIKSIDLSEFTYDEENTIKKLISEITAARISFGISKWQLSSEESTKLEQLYNNLDILLKTGEALDTDFTICLEGFSDPTGDADYNAYLCQRRAEAVKSHLERLGISTGKIEVKGVGVASDTDLQRKVIVKVSRTDG